MTEAHHQESSGKEAQSTSDNSIHDACKEKLHVREQERDTQREIERLKRLRRQHVRLKEWLATHEPRIGKQGKEIKSNVTDHDSAKMSTPHGVLQGYNAQAFVDAKHQVIMAAEVFGNATDSGHLSAVLVGAK